jgi:hypothetical protein
VNDLVFLPNLIRSEKTRAEGRCLLLLVWMGLVFQGALGFRDGL